MKITVAEARLLKNSVEQKVKELVRERNQIAFVEYEKGEEYTPYPRSFDEVTNDLQNARQHFRAVTEAIAKSNLTTKIEWQGNQITITEALELVKQLRAEASELKHFGQSKQVESTFGSSFGSNVFYKEALFDPMKVKKAGEELLKEANHLSILIDKANFNSFVEFDFVNQYQ